MKRAKLRGLKRNASVVLGNMNDPADVDVLLRALDDAEPLVYTGQTSQGRQPIQS